LLDEGVRFIAIVEFIMPCQITNFEPYTARFLSVIHRLSTVGQTSGSLDLGKIFVWNLRIYHVF
jgi:hypothetical protein